MNPYIKTIDRFRMRHCFINYETLERVAQNIAMESTLSVPSWRGLPFPDWDDDRIIEYFGVVNALNFCFTDFKTDKKFDVLYKSDKPWTGSYALAASITRAIEEGCDILNPRYLEYIKKQDVEQIFRHYSTKIPMFDERVEQLRSLGKSLNESSFHSFATLFRDCRYGLDYAGQKGILHSIFAMPAYHDSQYIENYELRFAKRAQLFPMVYHGRALSSEGRLQLIRDPQHFGAVADYQVPKALRILGILKYDVSLADCVDNGIVIKRDSRKEIEIRMATVFAMSALLERVNELRSRSINMPVLDFYIWSIGRDPSMPKSRHHYTYTTAY